MRTSKTKSRFRHRRLYSPLRLSIIILELYLVVTTLIISRSGFITAASSRDSPYKVLGVPKNASQEDIKKKYRALCLKFHPDKNVGSNVEERKRCEDTFKSIQHANSLIGDEESRKAHDSMSSKPNGNPFGSSFPPSDHPLRRHFRSDTGFNPNVGRYDYQTRRPAFYVNRVDISHLFPPRRAAPARRPQDDNPFFPQQHPPQSNLVNPNYPKSIFVEEVTVPLKDLYSGLDRMELSVSNGIFRRYIAAFRGGIAGPIALHGIMAAIPMLLRRSWPLPVLCFLATFHFGLPRPSRLYYSAHIKKGWKGGTKLKFFDTQSGLEVVFVLKEERHARFTRDGDNLRTTVTIGISKSKKGCTLLIDALGDDELPIAVRLKAGEIKYDEQIVTVKGRGWPVKSGGGKGDLLITVRVVSDARATKIRKKTMARRGMQ